MPFQKIKLRTAGVRFVNPLIEPQELVHEKEILKNSSYACHEDLLALDRTEWSSSRLSRFNLVNFE
jgi:hypothetical protein